MRQQLKPLNQQVIVITGASSGIGLATAKRAARRGAQVALVSRDEEDLARAVREIGEQGGRAVHPCMVQRGVDREAMVRQTFDQVVFPERARQVHRVRVEA